MEIATIQFESEGDEAWAFVRTHGNEVVLALSLRENGDLQVVLKAEDARSLLGALQRAGRDDATSAPQALRSSVGR